MLRKLGPGCLRKQVTFTLVDIRRQERDFNKSVLRPRVRKLAVLPRSFMIICVFCNQLDLTMNREYKVYYLSMDHVSGYNLEGRRWSDHTMHATFMSHY